MSLLETYIQSLRDIHATGAAVKETSYYGALETLFNTNFILRHFFGMGAVASARRTGTL